MQHYVGLDVSLKQTAVCVVDQAGKIRGEGMVASEPKAIADFIAANAPQVIRIGFESGATSTWLWTELKKLVQDLTAPFTGGAHEVGAHAAEHRALEMDQPHLINQAVSRPAQSDAGVRRQDLPMPP
jgi:hypothetical protein